MRAAPAGAVLPDPESLVGFALRVVNKLKRILLPKRQAASLMGSG